jgi:predicted Zn finger-like uncharacterized protein
MPLSVPCPSCKSNLFVEDRLAGKKIKCPKCSQVVAVAPAKPAAAVAGARAPAPAATKPPAPATKPSAPPPKPAAPSGSITIACACGKKLQVRAELAGKAVKCPGCGKPVRVPGAPAPAKPSAAAVTPPPAPAAPPAPPTPAPALQAAPPPPAVQDEEWTEVNEAVEAPPPAAAKGGPAGDWGESLMESHGVPDEMKEAIRTNLSKSEKILWFDRPRVDMLAD